MELQRLYYFVTLVDYFTFTAAAKKLHIAQPSLSAAIKKLEQELGFILLDRSKRELKLTKEGKILYSEAKKLLIHYDHVSDEMVRLKKEGPLELSIGIIESSKFWVPKVLTRFKEEYEDAHLQLLEILSLEDVQKALNRFEIHVAITNQYIDNDDHIESILLYKEQLVVLLPPSHPLKNKNFLTMKDLENERFIISKKGFQTREDILNAFRKAGVKPNIHFEIGRFETAFNLVEEGLGITVAPENYVKHMSRTNFHFKRIQDADLSRTVYLAFDKNRYLPPLVDRFVFLVKSYFSK